MSANVVHIAPAPLVGAPAKIVRALKQKGFNATSICVKDYPNKGPLNKKFVDESIVLADADSAGIELIGETLEQADIVHVHNDLPANQAAWLKRCTKPDTCFVYQVHSPLREGPLYSERADSIGLPFQAHLVVGQYQPRHYQSYLPVPNLVLDAGTLRERRVGDKLRVMFSPTHSRGGRWNGKASEVLERTLLALKDLGKIELIRPEAPLSPALLMGLRRASHVTIDEIVTGAFHQVSIEGLCAGNVVINRADFFSKSMMAQTCQADELPPFKQANESDILEVLLELADDPVLTAELQQESARYFSQYLQAENLIDRFIDIYEQLH
ncbi:MAG: hypothetical protein AB8C46_03625 [Burkholderiaceae bacterium]